MYFNWNAKGFEKNLPPDKKIKKFVEPAVAEALKKRGFNPGLVNWPKRVKSFLSEPYDMLPQLRLINEVAKRNGAKLSVFYIPARNQVTNYYYQFEKQFCRACPPEMDLTTEAFQIHSKKLSSTCNALGIPFLDFSELIKNEEKKGNHLYWNYDIHMRNTGYLTLGEKIYDWWHERELKQTVK
ncbi:MAG: hypothetical protein ACE5FU_01965 [Nitrospinota bacterium]